MTQDKSVTLLYHFFYPDDVVSARLFSDMASELFKRGWEVTVLSSNRYCRYKNKSINKHIENWKGVKIIRAFRPAWNQAKNVSRLGNALWLFFAWMRLLIKMPKSRYYIVGSDPQFSQIILPVIKLIAGKNCLIYWCHDIYPEAVIANNSYFFPPYLAYLIKPIIQSCYRYADIIADLGPCMRARLNAYKHKNIQVTLTPWALKEPEVVPEQNVEIRQALFGKEVKLGLLYSGNLGMAHDFEQLLALARKLRPIEPEIRFVFAGRGNRFQALRNAVTAADTNMRFAGFVPEAELEKRLAAADIHLISLKQSWDGIVVPSKFFGSLAAARPVLYAGTFNSDIGQWIKKFNCGIILNNENINEVAFKLVRLANDKNELHQWQQNAFVAYHQHFSKDKTISALNNLLNHT